MFLSFLVISCTGSDVLSYEYVGYSLSKHVGHTPSEAPVILEVGFSCWAYWLYNLYTVAS